jgi:hypothetical protein
MVSRKIHFGFGPFRTYRTVPGTVLPTAARTTISQHEAICPQDTKKGPAAAHQPIDEHKSEMVNQCRISIDGFSSPSNIIEQASKHQNKKGKFWSLRAFQAVALNNRKGDDEQSRKISTQPIGSAAKVRIKTKMRACTRKNNWTPYQTSTSLIRLEGWCCSSNKEKNGNGQRIYHPKRM